ncbi:hypothetical protein DRE_00806 [Drechslerella stenobrocha 248]|uniref:Sulfite reductase [NADPH] subunit beta n=1 Tax=Drechslerella stenobrocha 248 TaxID=1043628 RepID=W7HYZ1_9PEZI|nr:hypothetical protein DRE_00806 [Drechslerella stenobrocha 248]
MAPPGEMLESAEAAVARIAYLCSDHVISVQPSLRQKTPYSSQLDRLSAASTPGVICGSEDGLPQVTVVRHNADPFLSAFEPLRNGQLVSILTVSPTLVPSIPHLHKLANYPVAIHVSLIPQSFPDYSDIASVRQAGFTIIRSDSIQEAQDMAILAHGVAVKSGRAVIHFFEADNSRDDPVPLEDRRVIDRMLDRAAARSYQASTIDADNIYAGDGVQAQTRVTHPANGSLNGVRSPPQSPTSSRPNGSSLLQVNGASAGSEVASQNGSIALSRTASIFSDSESAYRPVNSADIFKYIASGFEIIRQVTSRPYRPFEYYGPTYAENAIFLFGSKAKLIETTIASAASTEDYARTGIVIARVYRPWSGHKLFEVLPKTVKKIAVLEQIKKRTTKWGPAFLDLLSVVRGDVEGTRELALVGYQLGYLSPSTLRLALRGVLQNLKLDRPVQNLDVGFSEGPAKSAAGYELTQPGAENAYMKVLGQLFGGRLYLANALGQPNAGIPNAISASPEYGFGSLLARLQKKDEFRRKVEAAAASRGFVTTVCNDWLAKWLISGSSKAKQSNDIADELILRLKNDGSSISTELLDERALFYKETNWLIGSDAWAYDLGNSGVHHVLASGKNINMLIIDSQPYSEKVVHDASRRKKDIGLYAMNFGNAYVASVAVYSSYTQVLHALIEAEEFDGPSVVLAYLPYNREDESPLTILQETKKAVDIGYWPLYRWNPTREEKTGQPNFELDSERIRTEMKDFLARDNHLSKLMQRNPIFSASLAGSYGSEVRSAQKRKAKDAYAKLLEGLEGAPVTILYTSDGGNSEGLAKRLQRRGKARGLKAIAMVMDDYPLEEINTEENLVLIASVAGQGEFPQNGRQFWEAVKNSTDIDLAGVNFAVFGLGDSHYWPRKEDRIYYNKPSKDLDARLEVLGGKRIVEIGLGDDQDPDAYQTAYAEWEPKLWAALGVDKVEGIPDEPPPITNEDIKIASSYLRGTIAEGLKDLSTMAISASDQQLTKFHGTYMQDDRDLRDERKAQGLEPAYSFMIRCRLPGGVATPEQWLQMDDICEQYGNQTMKLTTRQTFQFHGVIKTNLRSSMQAINRALMTTLAACGDVNRNVMCSSLPQSSRYHAQVWESSKRISDHLLPSTTAYHEIWLQEEGEKKVQVAGEALQDYEPLYGATYLPRKFKITIAVPPHNDTDVYAHDVGLIAIKGEDGGLAGFNLLVGGGMGVTHNNKKTYPRTGSMLGYVSKENVHLACEKVMLVQRDHGDRKNRKHARLKYTVDDMGVDVFRGKVEDLLGFAFEPAREFAFESNIDTFGWQRDENGGNHFTFFIENGRVEDTPEFQMRTGLREIAKVHKGDFRLTGNQHVILSNVADSDLDAIKALMQKYKLDNVQFSGLRLSSSACVAFPTCGLAMAESERYLPKLIDKLEDTIEAAGLRHDSIVMRMTGCPNGCARPWVAEIAFVGKAYGAYNMYLGGGYHGQRLNKLYRSSIKEEEILEILKPMIKRYALEREEGERFGDWCIRAKIIKETTHGTNFHDDVAEEDTEE